MGYAGAKVDLDKVRKAMGRSRTEMKKGSRGIKVQRFCNDKDAFNWCCRHYRYTYWLNNGNVPHIDNETYSNYLDMLTDRSNYNYAVKELTSSINLSPEAKYLLDGIRMLRKRYM